MRRIQRTNLRAPARVMQIAIDQPLPANSPPLSVSSSNTMWCLARRDGLPCDISFWDVSADEYLDLSDLTDKITAQLPKALPKIDHITHPRQVGLTVAICTRDRPLGLRTVLKSLANQSDHDFETLVVDNGRDTNTTATVVTQSSLNHITYLAEPSPGLSRARNCALSATTTDFLAWIDDDEVADPDWVLRLKQGFQHDARPAAVCGLMFPAELESEAQVLFEQYGGFNKGRGLHPEVLVAATASITNPLYPLPSFGAGGNMAFQTKSLRAIGGFDPSLGAGTRTHGGEETRALSMLLLAGSAVLHWPPAITWHTHRRDMTALRQQLYGYSAGLTAFYASMLRSKPSRLIDILRVLPLALRDILPTSTNLRKGALPADFPPELLRASRRGFLTGAPLYVYESLRHRRDSPSTHASLLV